MTTQNTATASAVAERSICGAFQLTAAANAGRTASWAFRGSDSIRAPSLSADEIASLYD